MNATDKLRNLLADDNPAFLAGTTRILQQDYVEIGTASDGSELLEGAKRFSLT